MPTQEEIDTLDAEERFRYQMYSLAPELYAWCKHHYQLEEGPGETNRPEYIHLREIFKRIEG